MAFTKQPNKTPRVPIETPVFNEKSAQDLTLSRTWVLFFERLFAGAGKGGAAGPYQRTLLLKDTTVGNDVADHVTVWGAAGTVSKVVGVLRRAITSDLTVRIKVDGSTLGTFTIPHTTAVDTPVEFTTFSGSTAVTLDQVFAWDVTASDGQMNAGGIASFTVLWA